MATRTLEALLDTPEEWALFLDIDGTLLDLAPTPDSIQVPEALPGQLNRLYAKLDGAMALVTGRSLSFADQLFKPFAFPLAGLHGAEYRDATGVSTAAESGAFETLKRQLAREAESYPGVLIEDKGGAVAAHYRLAPEYEEILHERMQHYAEMAGPGWALQLGKMVFELRPARASKGDAVERFLQADPFKGRRPVAMGDDLTDESMFAVTNARGGLSVRVGALDAPTCAVHRLSSPVVVRNVLARLAA
ncbi:trehalose-phosphatase [Rhizobium sp. CG5]|uniref:trehalose-phosphatase n=1 Tax=Rhizobium sp. CG5 TaxID=2726076 RepID=UPI002034015D|nr:trehalose-phosphatase [Rhizobium sp. CG5]MCM2474373.1 trehalose-phosphatase [Rhizobium sp. CG5]